jgi:6-phosphogluconolactonase
VSHASFAPPLMTRQTFPSAETLYEALSHHIAIVAAEAIAARNSFTVVIPGGKTVAPLYRRLSKLETPWQAWRVFWTDERCVPANDAERNSKQAFDAWLGHVPIPADRVSPIPAELGPQVAADYYSHLLATEGPFDLVLLSLGEDGHVASVFPGAKPEDSNTPPALPVIDAPKLPAQRVSLSLLRLANTNKTILLAVGAGKAAALQGLVGAATKPASVLAQMTNVDIWADQSAKGANVSCINEGAGSV